jgi:hypothetical protein
MANKLDRLPQLSERTRERRQEVVDVISDSAEVVHSKGQQWGGEETGSIAVCRPV